MKGTFLEILAILQLFQILSFSFPSLKLKIRSSPLDILLFQHRHQTYSLILQKEETTEEEEEQITQEKDLCCNRGSILYSICFANHFILYNYELCTIKSE